MATHATSYYFDFGVKTITFPGPKLILSWSETFLKIQEGQNETKFPN